MGAAEIRERLDGFDRRYAEDWSHWSSLMETTGPSTPDAIRMLDRLLRKWQALRPNPYRTAVGENGLDQVLQGTLPLIDSLGDLDLCRSELKADGAERTLARLWDVLLELPARGHAGCVGISKVVMLLTAGRLGPALDSFVRRSLQVRKPPASAAEWIALMRAISRDIAAFEDRHGRLQQLAGSGFSTIGIGRLYDMLAGPREDRERRK